MDLFFQQVLDGITAGAIYGALALSIVLVYRASGIVNFAQGEMAMFGAFITWQLYSWGFPLVASIVIAMLISFFGGVATERIFIRPFAKNPSHLPLIIVTLGIMLVINSGAGWLWGYLTKEFPPVYGEGAIRVAGMSISRQGLGTIASVIAVAGVLFWLFQKTKFGLYLRAASSNPESAALSGVPVGRMLMIGWGLAAALGSLVGALVAPQLFLQPNMATTLLLYAFAAAALGGFDSPVGALVGGLIVGVSENLAGTYISLIGNEFKQGVALAIIMCVLMFKPEGLFGKKTVVRV